MADKKYNIIFTGKILEGKDSRQVFQKLAEVFKTDIKKINNLFKGSGSVIKRNVDYHTAEKYLKVIKLAGAVCHIAEIKSETPHKGLKSGDSQPTADSVVQSKVFPLQLGAANFSFSPIVSNRITGWTDGINLNRNDRQEVSFADIALVSVFSQSDISQEECKLLFYTHSDKRPFIVDSNKIAYSDFPMEMGISTISSLRHFVNLLCTKNKNILMNEGTANFLSGNQPMTFRQDISILTTALAQALVQPTTVPRPAEVPSGRKFDEQTTQISSQKEKPSKVETENAVQKILTMQKNTALSARTMILEEADVWSKRTTLYFSLMLILGFMWPLLKHSILNGSTVLILPWHIMGFGMDREMVAATTTISSRGNMITWTLLPLLSGIGVLLLRFTNLKVRSFSIFILGTTLVVLFLVVYTEKAEIFGLIFTPPTRGAGIIITILLLASGLSATANHLRKIFKNHLLPRLLAGVGGGLLITLSLIALFVSSDAWKAWPMIVLYIALLVYSILCILNTFWSSPNESLLQWNSIMIRGIIVAFPIACLISQTYSGGEYAEYVMEGSAGLIHNVMSLIKCALIYYGSAFIMITGLTGILVDSLAQRISS